MDTVPKLELVASQMDLEVAEDADTRGWEALRSQACGHSPSELRRAFSGSVAGRDRRAKADSAAVDALAKGAGDSARGLDAKKDSLGIHDAVMPGGKRLPLLKTMLTTVCERDCYYCPFRAGRDHRRTTFKPEEMARVFSQMQRAGVAQGIFLSSGIAGGGRKTQDRLIEAIDILRRKLGYRGYVHLKLMPGVERDQVFRAMQLADRVSVNLEAPNSLRLSALAPQKVFLEELLQPLQWAEEIRRTQSPALGWNRRWPSTVTQFVVGAAGESDVEILSAAERLYRDLRLSRAYFSAFFPVKDTPLENRPPENPVREHRLYQSSFLLRDYGFDLEELPFGPGGRLPLESDPKLAWARLNLEDTPVDLRRADRRELLRVPGIGPKGADAIIAARRRGTLRELADLKKIGVLASRAAPFVLLDGKRPARPIRLF